MGVAEVGMGFMPYGPRWRTHRKLFHDFISISTANNYDPHQVKVVSDFLVNMNRSPEDFMKHIHLCALHPGRDTDSFDV